MLTKRKYDVTEVTARIRQLKEEKEVTLQEIAAGAGIGLSTVKQYMTGKRIPDQYNLKRIADYFGVLEGWIVGETPYKTDNERIYATVSDEQYAEIYQELAFWNWMEKQFNLDYDLSQYSPDQLGQLECDIRNYAKSRIDQLKKEGKKE